MKLDELSPGATISAGNCPTVGAGGLISAGGYGTLTRKHGLTADGIISAKLIDYNGTI